MDFAQEIAQLFRRDLTRLVQKLEAFPDDERLWRSIPGVSTSAGNLALNLDGNLREFIGRQLGDVPHNDDFAAQGLPKAGVIERLSAVRELVPSVLARLSPESLDATFPEQVYGAPLSTRQLVLSLHARLNDHLGQIDYLRHILTNTQISRPLLDSITWADSTLARNSWISDFNGSTRAAAWCSPTAATTFCIPATFAFLNRRDLSATSSSSR